jgi:hypothetical protein
MGAAFFEKNKNKREQPNTGNNLSVATICCLNTSCNKAGHQAKKLKLFLHLD